MNLGKLLGVVIAVFFLAAGATALADEGDSANGEKVFEKNCGSCHTIEGKSKFCPSLDQIFGRPAGAYEDFKYSKAFKEAGFIWSEETLDAFLAKPGDVVPGNRMGFRGIKEVQDRYDLITYLKQAAQ